MIYKERLNSEYDLTSSLYMSLKNDIEGREYLTSLEKSMMCRQIGVTALLYESIFVEFYEHSEEFDMGCTDAVYVSEEDGIPDGIYRYIGLKEYVNEPIRVGCSQTNKLICWCDMTQYKMEFRCGETILCSIEVINGVGPMIIINHHMAEEDELVSDVAKKYWDMIKHCSGVAISKYYKTLNGNK